jgi:hypothetical protein
VATAVQSHFSIKVNTMLTNQERLDQGKAELQDLVKARLVEEVIKLQDFNTIMKIRDVFNIYANTKI